MRRQVVHWVKAGVSLPALMAGVLLAQDVMADMVLEEIVVTARKRTENLQDVPISVYAKTGEALQKAGVTDSLAVDDLVPNLEIKTFGGQPNIFIRGVGNNDFNATTISPVSMYIDGVLLGLTGSQSMPMFDMERVEVLRGPQGTLFGRNTTGGALVYHTRKPGDSFEGTGRLSVGNYDRLDAELAATIPLSEKTSLRIAGASFSNDGDHYNVTQQKNVNAIDMKGARATLLSTPSDDLEIIANIHWSVDRSDFRQGKQAPDAPDILGYLDPTPDDRRLLYLDGPNRHYADQFGGSLTLNWDVADITIKSISAYEEAQTDFCGDIDQSPNSLDHLCFATDGKQYSQEINLSGSAAGGLSWILGGYYLREDMSHSTEGPLFGDTPFALPVDGLSHRVTDTLAAFAEVTYDITDRLKVNVGLRYTYEKKDADVESAVNLSILDQSLPDAPAAYLVPFTELNKDWNALSGRVALSYNINDDVMAYASFSRGFKSGGFNLGSFFDPNEVTTVDPEFLNAYEIGLKSTFLDKRVRVNLSGFYYDYSDLQVYTYAAGSSPATPVVFALENAADAEIYGLEAEFTALPMEGLNIEAGLGLLETKYKNFISLIGGDLSGNRLPGAPSVNVNVAADYTFPVADNLSMMIRGEYSYTSKRYFNSFQDEAISSRGGHGLLNGRISLSSDDDKWELALWGRNLANKDYIVDSTDLRGTFGFIPQYLGERRSYGLELIVRFN